MTAAGEWRHLRQGQCGIPGSRWHVDDQVVEFAPLDVGQELLDQSVNHGSTPDDGGVVIHEERHRHEFHALSDERHDLAIGGRVGSAVNARQQ